MKRCVRNDGLKFEFLGDEDTFFFSLAILKERKDKIKLTRTVSARPSRDCLQVWDRKHMQLESCPSDSDSHEAWLRTGLLFLKCVDGFHFHYIMSLRFPSKTILLQSHLHKSAFTNGFMILWEEKNFWYKRAPVSLHLKSSVPCSCDWILQI